MKDLRPIKDYPDYFVSKEGEVYSSRRSRLRKLKGSLSSTGYFHVLLFNEEGKKFFNIHRLVLSAFVDNPDNKPTVNHKNGIKTDNRLSNLEWCTYRENNLHSYRQLGHKSSMYGVKGSYHQRSQPVVGISQYSGVMLSFDNIREATQYLNKTSHSPISQAVSGKRKTAYNYLWVACPKQWKNHHERRAT